MAQHPADSERPNPGLFFKHIWGYVQTAALRAAVELDLFTAVHDLGAEATSPKIAERIKAAERSTRMLLDHLAVEGFFTKNNQVYSCTPSTNVFLVRSSKLYIGGATEFLASAEVTVPFQNFAAVVRSGTTPLPDGGTTAKDHEVWVKFARGMAGTAMMTAQMLVNTPDVMPPNAAEPLKVLDVAAGHGMYGIHVAQKYTASKVTFLDWAAVLEVAKENAAKFGVADRCEYIAGSALEADLKGPYDVILLTNILHHFDHAGNMAQALKPNGRIITLEFVPNEERTAPPNAVMFSLMMLATTRAGDAYTFSQFDAMFKEAGVSHNRIVPLPTGSSLIVSTFN